MREGGRSLPEGLRYVDSWVRADLGGCFQLVECDDARLLQEWIAAWGDLTDFDVVPVTTSKVTQDLMTRLYHPLRSVLALAGVSMGRTRAS